MEGTRQLFVPVFQEGLGNFLRRYGQVHWHDEGFSIPVSSTAVLFTGKALRPDIKARVTAVVGHEELEDVETDPLLSGRITVNRHVTACPALVPDSFMVGQVLGKSLAGQFGHQFVSLGGLFFISHVPAGDDDDVLFQFPALAAGQSLSEQFADFTAGGRHVTGNDFPVFPGNFLQENRELRSAEVVWLGPQLDAAAVSVFI